MASQTTVLLSLAALVCLAAFALAAPQRFDDHDDLVSVFRERRTSQGRMRGYAGLTMRRGSSVVFAGASSRHAPKYVVPAESAEDEEEAPEVQPLEASEEQGDELQDQLEDEEEQTPAPVKPVRPSRARPSAAKPSRPARPQKPQQEEEEEEDVPAPPKRGSKQRGGATAIASSRSVGDGASAKSHAIAYDGHFSGGQFRHRYQ